MHPVTTVPSRHSSAAPTASIHTNDVMTGVAGCERTFLNALSANIITHSASTDAEYLATKEWQTDSVVVTFDGSTIHIEHHNMVLDCNKNPMFNNYLTTEGDTLVVHEDVGEQGNTNCFCLYDNWMDVEGSPRYRYLRIVLEYSYSGNNESATVFESMFMKLSPQKQ